MQTAIGITNGKFGKANYQRGAFHRYRTGRKQPEEKKVTTPGKRHDFLTERIRPFAPDYAVTYNTGEPAVNLTTPKNLDFLYRSALRYTELLGIKLPFRHRKGGNPRMEIPKLYRVMEEILPEQVNIEEADGKLHFCLYRFHDWPGHTLFWIPIDFTEKLSVPVRRIAKEFIRRFARHHRLYDLTETYHYELAWDELEDWENRDSETTPKEVRMYKKLAASYRSGKIAKAINRMSGKSFCPHWEEKVRTYRTENRTEGRLLEIIREGMGLITPDSPRLSWYEYDWAYEQDADFRPIELRNQVMLVYSVNDALTNNMADYFNADYHETYAITPVTYTYLAPDMDKPFHMDDYPEKLSKWMKHFLEFIEQHFYNDKNE